MHRSDIKREKQLQKEIEYEIMQYNPSNNYGNPYVNQYPPVHQPQFGTENIYPYVIFFKKNFAIFER